MKRSSSELVSDLLNGEFELDQFSNMPLSELQQSINTYLETHYDIDDSKLIEAIKERRSDLERLSGVALSDEQLNALTAGKSNDQVAKDGAIVGASIGGAGVAVTTAGVGALIAGLFIAGAVK